MNARVTAVVFVTALLGWTGALLAKPSFAGVAGTWTLDGDVRLVLSMGETEANTTTDLVDATALFAGKDFSIAWDDEDDILPEPEVVGEFQQKNKKVTAKSIGSEYFEALVRGECDGDVDLVQGPSKLNITVTSDTALKGEVQIQYRITQGDVRGKAIFKIKFTGTKIVPPAP